VKRVSSGEIQIGVRKGEVPSAKQGAELKAALAEALKTQDAIDNLSNAEKDLEQFLLLREREVWIKAASERILASIDWSRFSS
jgi:hypothetical protein